RLVLETDRGPAAPGEIIPAAAPDHPQRPAGGALRVARRALLVIALGIPVVAPLPDVAVHVIQAPGVRRERAHGAGPLQVRAPDRRAVWFGPVEVGLLAGEGVAVVEGRFRAGAAGIFPLRLARQSVDAPRLLLRRQGRQFLAER